MATKRINRALAWNSTEQNNRLGMRGIGKEIDGLGGLQRVAVGLQDIHVAAQRFGAAGNIDDTLGRGVAEGAQEVRVAACARGIDKDHRGHKIVVPQGIDRIRADEIDV